jgi:hypothetical protein
MFRQLLSLLLAVLVALSAVMMGQSQTKQTAPVSTKQASASKRADRPVTVKIPEELLASTMPQGANAWVIQINSGGGFGNTVSEIVTITSTGEVTCAESPAPDLEPAKLDELSQLVAAVSVVSAKSSDSRSLRPSSLCKDCTQTTLVLSRRGAKQKTKTYATSWDTVTRALLAEDLAQLYDSVSALGLCHK